MFEDIDSEEDEVKLLSNFVERFLIRIRLKCTYSIGILLPFLHARKILVRQHESEKWSQFRLKHFFFQNQREILKIED